jgi:hypothetical protein
MRTIDDAMAYATSEIDRVIARYLRALEAKMRMEMELTGPEDEGALDRVPDPSAPWRRSTVEEVLLMERAQLETWRAETLAGLRTSFQTILP